jgi:DNA-binding transcriptional ArsR family regulator
MCSSFGFSSSDMLPTLAARQQLGASRATNLRVLEDAHLIERRVDAQWRLCGLKAAPLKQASEWIERYRRFWESGFDRLTKFLDETQPKRRR